MLRRSVVALALVIIGLAGCGSDPGAAPAGGPSPSSAPASPSPTPSTSAEAACGETAPGGVRVADVAVRSTDGVTLTAVEVGSGSKGVVLMHQTDNGICGWLGYAGHLAQQGFHVLAFDRRCTGESTCPEGEAAQHHLADVTAATTALRRAGASDVVVVGASLGGAVTIGSCAATRAVGCVALSPAVFDYKLGGGVTPRTAITDVRVPLLVAVAPDDGDSPLAEVQEVVGKAREGVVRLVELPSGGTHGWDTVRDPTTGEPTPFSAQLVAFLDDRLS